MSFRETPCWIAICDSCKEEAEYEEFSGYGSKQDAVACAGDWIEVDGTVTCAECRTCDRCGSKGGSSGDHGFLCHLCWQQVCEGCGHQLRWHYTATNYSVAQCAGVRPGGVSVTLETCSCAEFATATG